MACFLLWFLPFSDSGGMLFACYILSTYGSGYAVLMGVQIANTAGYTKRAIASSGLYIGYAFGKSFRTIDSITERRILTIIGNFTGPLLFKEKDAPQYNSAFAATTVTAIVAACCGVAYRYVCVWDNKKRDKAGTVEAFDHAYEDDLTDLKVSAPLADVSLESFLIFSRTHSSDISSKAIVDCEGCAGSR